MTKELKGETVEKISQELNKKNYILSIQGNNKELQIILKTAFEKEIQNRIKEIENIIKQEENIEELDNDQIKTTSIIYQGKQHKAIKVKAI